VGVLAVTTRDEALALLKTLIAKLNREQREIARFDDYYNGKQDLAFIAPEVEAMVGDRLTSLVINWPRTITDSVHRRTHVEGFRIGDAGDLDDELLRLWYENGLDERHPLGQLDALVHKIVFLSVWGNEEDPLTPSVRFESAHQMTALYDAEDWSRVRAALKRWTGDDGRQYATLYLPDMVVRHGANGQATSVRLPWQVEQVLDNPLGAVPIVPLPNRPRLLNPDGVSELSDVLPLVDAVNKLATDMMVGSEFHALPRRTATGLQFSSNPKQVERFREEVRLYWDMLAKGRTMLGGQGVHISQLPGADLSSFVNAISLLTAQIAAIAGLPPHFLGINTDNPASADAIRAAEATLVERAIEKQSTWGGAYKRAMCLAIAARDGVPLRDVPSQYRRMETVWKDPATPTPAQAMDAAVKGVQVGIYDTQAAQESVGMSKQQRDAFVDRVREARDTAATADVQAKLALARQLVREDGLTFNAALAAVGLLQAAGLNAAETA
jgi:hypothetical protein